MSTRSIPMRNSIAGSTSNYFAPNSGGHFAEFSDISRDQPFVEYFIPRSMSDFNLSLIKPEGVPTGQILQPVLKNKNGAKPEAGKMRVTFQDDMGVGEELPPPPATDEFM